MTTGEIVLTTQMVMDLKPCSGWPRGRVNAMLTKYPGATVADALRCDEISASDRVWLGISMLPDRLQWEFAALQIESILALELEHGREPDDRTWAVVEALRAKGRGEISQAELDAVSAGASAAASAASTRGCAFNQSSVTELAA